MAGARKRAEEMADQGFGDDVDVSRFATEGRVNPSRRPSAISCGIPRTVVVISATMPLVR